MLRTGERAPETGLYVCRRCKVTVRVRKGATLPECPVCVTAVEWKAVGAVGRARGTAPRRDGRAA
jgi:hypothetical protein